MDRRERLGVFRNRAKALAQLGAIVISDVPDTLPEIQQLRMRLSQSRALVLVIEVALQSLYEREVPRSERTVDPNAYLNHQEARALVTAALQLVERAKEVL